MIRQRVLSETIPACCYKIAEGTYVYGTPGQMLWTFTMSTVAGLAATPCDARTRRRSSSAACFRWAAAAACASSRASAAAASAMTRCRAASDAAASALAHRCCALASSAARSDSCRDRICCDSACALQRSSGWKSIHERRGSVRLRLCIAVVKRSV